MKFWRSISFRIWVYFSFTLLVVFAVIFFYYPSKQKKLVYEYRGKELQELAKVVAIGVEMSYESTDFTKLFATIEQFKSKKSDYDFLALYNFDSTANHYVPANFLSKDNKLNFSNLDTSKFLIKEGNYESKIASGKIVIGLAKNNLDASINKINYPIYFTLGALMLFSFALLYFTAKSISAPIRKIISNARLLEENLYDQFNLKNDQERNEMGELQRSLISLKDTLQEQKKTNTELLGNLEARVASRTASLQETLKLLNEARDIARLANFTYYPETKQLIYSENFSQVLNLRDKPIENLRSFLPLLGFENTQQWENALHSVKTEESRLEFQINQNGESNWIALQVKLLQEIDKTNYYFFGTIQDISSRKKSEEENRKLSLLAENTTNGVVFTDTDKKIVWVNESIVQLTGYSREEIYGKSPKMFQFEETDEKTNVFISEKLSKGEAVKAEIQNRGKTGNTYWLEINIQPIFNNNRELTGFMAIEIDITERKEKEKLITNYIQEIESKQREITLINESLEQKVIEKTKDISRLASFPEQFDHPIIEFILPSNEIIYKNPKAISIFNEPKINPIELFGIKKGMLEVQTFEKREININDRIYNATLFHLKEEDVYRLYFYDTTIIQQNEKRLEGLVNALKITEQELKSNQHELQQSLESLTKSQEEIVRKEKLATLGVLVAGIAHEVNTPLGAIKASSDNLEFLFLQEFFSKVSLVTTQELKICLDIFSCTAQETRLRSAEERELAKQFSENLLTLFPHLSDHRNLSKQLVNLGYRSITPEVIKIISEEPNYVNIFSVAELFSKIYVSLRTINDATLKSSRIIKALNNYSHSGEQYQMADFNLRESIDNVIAILWNKIKRGATIKNHLPEKLLVKGFEDELSQVWTNIINNALQAGVGSCNIEIHYQKQDHVHEISIENDGPRIPESVIDKIFDEFFTTKKRGEGTGLGLNIVKKIVEKHKGAIRCESQDKSTKFIITLPIEL